jgi:hypothetical protein
VQDSARTSFQPEFAAAFVLPNTLVSDLLMIYGVMDIHCSIYLSDRNVDVVVYVPVSVVTGTCMRIYEVQVDMARPNVPSAVIISV